MGKSLNSNVHIFHSHSEGQINKSGKIEEIYNIKNFLLVGKKREKTEVSASKITEVVTDVCSAEQNFWTM
jgi:hypothetical protein